MQAATADRSSAVIAAAAARPTSPAAAPRRARREDESAEAVPALLSAEDVRELSRLRPAVAMAWIAFQWLSIAACIGLCLAAWHPVLYVLAVVWIGARQHGLLVIAHEAAHGRLFQGKRLGDGVSDLLLGWPMFACTRIYRDNHFSHHRHTNHLDLDPDMRRKAGREEWRFPKSRAGMLWLFAKDCVGLCAHKQLFMALHLTGLVGVPERARPPLHYRAAQVAFYAALFGALYAFDAWVPFVLFWLVPYATWLAAIMHLRSVAEHFGVPGTRVLNKTRTTVAGVLERWLVAPFNIHYHIEHHLYPSIPFYNLPRAHRMLMEIPEYAEGAHVTYGYANVLRECEAVHRDEEGRSRAVGGAVA